MKKYIGIIGAVIIGSVIPTIVFAQGVPAEWLLQTQDGTLGGVIKKVGGWIQALTPLVVALALLYFFWGVANFIRKSGDSGARDDAKQQMLWGVVALFVMISVWGLVYFVQESFDIDRSAQNKIRTPSLPSSR